MTHAYAIESILEPELPIVDAHHHLWHLAETHLRNLEAANSLYARSFARPFRRHQRYLFGEYLADLQSGHNVLASVFVDAHAMYRLTGPPALRSVGEVEFVSGCAAMAESGLFGDVKMCAGIIGGVDLRMGESVEDVLHAHIQAGGGRYRGVRSPVAWDEDESILGADNGEAQVLLDPAFRRGFAQLNRFGLSFDVFLFDPQLPELIDLARTFPETAIILDHVGTPLAIGRFAGSRESRFPIWCKSMQELARCSNVAVKLGGLGTSFGGSASFMSQPPASSVTLAEEWRPYIQTCIESFGVDRCMFESNFPVDAATCSYGVLWNAFKRLSHGASAQEKAALFEGTASRVYRLDISMTSTDGS